MQLSSRLGLRQPHDRALERVLRDGSVAVHRQDLRGELRRASEVPSRLCGALLDEPEERVDVVDTTGGGERLDLAGHQARLIGKDLARRTRLGEHRLVFARLVK